MPAERELETLYFGHWQGTLQFYIRKATLSSEESALQIGEAPPGSLSKVKPLDESWKVITLPSLLRAVMNIREDFEELSYAQHHHFSEKCFRDLHSLVHGTTEPAVFKTYFVACIEQIEEIVKHSFGRFLEISLNQNGLIGAAPVHWAFLQAFDLIEREDRLVEGWVKSVCDEPSNSLPSSNEEFIEKIVFRTDWRGPKWLVMQPNGNRLYDSSTAWD